MREQKRSPLSPEEQRRFKRRIAVTVAGMFRDTTRPEGFRGYIDRASCGRTAPGFDVLVIAFIAIRAGRSREDCRALPKMLLDLVDAQFPPEIAPTCPVAAAREEAEFDGHADAATLEAVGTRRPEALERAAELRERQAAAGLRVAQAFRSVAQGAARFSDASPYHGARQPAA